MNTGYDLHCHSTASDGVLTPAALMQRAKKQSVTCIALTDHDTTAGLPEAQQSATELNIKLIPGIELSTTWNNKCLHIVGLNINPQHAPLLDGMKHLQSLRIERAQKISDKLLKKRIPGAFEAVTADAGCGMITRSHFAKFLFREDHVSSIQNAFDVYLGRGKPAYVNTEWTDLEQAVAWITDCGGVAVLAHPLRYKLTARWMRRLLPEFKEMGGQAIEVISGRNNPDEINISSKFARQFDLAGSVGSDFHTPETPWVELGRLNTLPADIQPVWELLH